jgi:hypothetical protein
MQAGQPQMLRLSVHPSERLSFLVRAAHYCPALERNFGLETGESSN